MRGIHQKIDLNTYWSGQVYYPGPILNEVDIRSRTSIIKGELVSICMDISDVVDEDFDLSIMLCKRRKAFMLTDETYPMPDGYYRINHEAVLEEAIKIYSGSHIVGDHPVEGSCIGNELHDVIAHEVIGSLIDSERLREIYLPLRLKHTGPLNIHTIFGKLLPPIFLEELKKGESRESILNNMKSKLIDYLKGSISLTCKKGKVYLLDEGITKYEKEMALSYHRLELPISYYEPAMYRRYCPYKTYEGTLLSYKLDERYTEVLNLPDRTIYEDSFFLRDMAIQTALSNL
jgi:hypothetical protein